MNPVRQKIKNNLDALESAMNAQKHLDQDSIVEVLMLIESCAKFWRGLSHDERDWLNAVKFAVDESKRWDRHSPSGLPSDVKIA